MNVKHFAFLSIIIFACQSCSNTSNTKSDQKDKIKELPNNSKVYIMTVSQGKFYNATGKFKPNNTTDSLRAGNDTIAYLTALKKFYNQRIIERKNFNYGQLKSFMITDKDGIDLKVKLSDKLTQGLKGQVESMPDVKNMLEEYKKDSL